MGIDNSTDICYNIYNLNRYKKDNITKISLHLDILGKEVPKNMKKQKKAPLYQSFGWAAEGIFSCIRTERNIKIHLCAMLLVIIAGVLLKISITEWCICLVLCALVISLELVNTAVEAVVDLVTQEKHPLAKKAKDTAAGAVLAAAVFAAVCGILIFLPKLCNLLFV